MEITFWGTRGSIPTPGKTTVKYGGNTPCVELRFDNQKFIILDAGTGIRNLGEKIIGSGSSINTCLLISHPHWDHIQGFPFFKPAFISGNEITIVCAEFDGISLSQMISDQMNKVYFPVQLNELKANIKFKSVQEEEFDVQGVNVTTLFLNHPLFAIGYRITYRNKSVTYISDNEPFDRYVAQTIKNVHKEIVKKYLEYKDEPNQRLFDFVMGTDILIYDSTYTPEEYINRVGWGHSHYLFSLKVAAEGKVKNLVLFHHDPSHDDPKIDEIHSKCLKEINNRNYQFSCVPAYEGFTMYINT